MLAMDKYICKLQFYFRINIVYIEYDIQVNNV